MIEEDVPEGRCGFVLEPEDFSELYAAVTVAKSDPWYERIGVACCWRETWGDEDTDRCIWHAEIDGKAAEELVEAHGDRAERLDGVYLQEAELQDEISFRDCRMRGASLGGTNLRRADLGGADLYQAALGGAKLWRADLEDADLREADLEGAILEYADLEDADLREADLEGAKLGGPT